jgi:acetylornithine/succinyldiaminopimelate/putrescine aminotransferase
MLDNQQARLSLYARAQLAHLDQYGGDRLPYTCINANGNKQDFVCHSGCQKGSTVETIDVTGGYGTACLGARHPVVAEALRVSYDQFDFVSDQLGSHSRAEFIERILGQDGIFTEHFTADEFHVSGRSSGSEGMEMALRLVLEHMFDFKRQRPKKGWENRRRILAFEGAWHGWTAGLIELIDRRFYRSGLPTFTGPSKHAISVDFIPFGEEDALEAYFKEHGKNLGAVFVEPIQGDAGVVVPPKGYLRRIQQLCKSSGCLLVADEVLTFAKTEDFFAMRDDDGAIPTDITVIGKSIGMGVMPFSLVVARKELATRTTGALCTYDLRAIACGAIVMGLDHIHSNGLIQSGSEFSSELRSRLQTDVVANFPEIFFELRGRGSMTGIELQPQAVPSLSLLRKCLFEAGIWVEFMSGVNKSNGHRIQPTVRIIPPLITPPSDCDEIVKRIVAGCQNYLVQCAK